jgi:hypothetical protein
MGGRGSWEPLYCTSLIDHSSDGIILDDPCLREAVPNTLDTQLITGIKAIVANGIHTPPHSRLSLIP